MGKKEAYHDEIELEDFEYDVIDYQFQEQSIYKWLDWNFISILGGLRNVFLSMSMWRPVPNH